MGRIYTATGIGINFGGTVAPTNNLALGTGSDIYFSAGSGGTRGLLSFDALNDNIRLETDNGNITIYAEGPGNAFGTVRIAMGTGAELRVDKVGTQIMRLKPNGDLLIAGTIGQNIVF